ncbi:uncharacterized protein Bfra_012092 [Botrytis fragariae]|uniref:Uncharacterized protein n=1 Tax=Botrytis fragariae TaxID=1964551 RepID=A0A8H6AK29_9HELO|nr:uncharacterized protein Bfra_012092 [Botrytis fragariae]KAF5868761.1 hypothetical protein Bfra_012092 [Botrytis fragariae]
MKLSPPGWVLTIITTVTIATRIVNMIDPSNTTKEFNINSPEAVRLISYLLILINLYEFIAAFQDNWVAYKFGIVSRLAAVGVFWDFGGEWVKVVFVELGTLVLLAEL